MLYISANKQSRRIVGSGLASSLFKILGPILGPVAGRLGLQGIEKLGEIGIDALTKKLRGIIGGNFNNRDIIENLKKHLGSGNKLPGEGLNHRGVCCKT